MSNLTCLHLCKVFSKQKIYVENWNENALEKYFQILWSALTVVKRCCRVCKAPEKLQKCYNYITFQRLGVPKFNKE